MDNFSAGVLIVVSAVGAFLFGPWVPLMGTLLILMFADVVSGLCASANEGKLNSKRGHVGIGKKVFVWIIIAICYHVDAYILQTGTYLRDGALVFYSINEMVSIVENAGRSGLPVPSKLRRLIDVLRSDDKVTKNKEESPGK